MTKIADSDERSLDHGMPTVEEVDAALEAFRRGLPEKFDRLLGDGEPRICKLFTALLDGFRRRQHGWFPYHRPHK